jgi:hypothetical protein
LSFLAQLNVQDIKEVDHRGWRPVHVIGEGEFNEMQEGIAFRLDYTLEILQKSVLCTDGKRQKMDYGYFYLIILYLSQLNLINMLSRRNSP